MRYTKQQILSDLTKKMVFVAGPRQVGKTTLAKSLIVAPAQYCNWDDDDDRQRILQRDFPEAPGILVLDEIHKFRRWRNYLKGLYDTHKSQWQILVTGSAKLDAYRFGGDSLQGRYHLLRMHPLSVAELGGAPDTLTELLHFGGFPEPFFGKDTIDARRWSQQYRTRLIREDMISLERVDDLGRIEALYLRLPDLVGSPLSINNLREDLQVHHTTVSKWIQILERLYAIFRLLPFGGPTIKAVKKEQKHYHMDWTLVENEGARFENLVACHLLKWVQWRVDAYGELLELRYYRDPAGREVDFVVCDHRQPVMFVECKIGDDAINPALRYLRNKFPATPAYQVSLRGSKNYETDDAIRVCPAHGLLATLV